MSQVAERLVEMLEERGWQGTIVPIGRLADLEGAIRGAYERGLPDETLYREQLDGFRFDPPEDLPAARSIPGRSRATASFFTRNAVSPITTRQRVISRTGSIPPGTTA